MEDLRVFGVFLLIASCIVRVYGLESTIFLSAEEGDLSCIYSVPGDPTDWVPKVSADGTYEVGMDPFCVDSSYMQLGVIAANPSRPSVLFSSDRLDQSILFFELAPDGDVETFYQSSRNVTGMAVDYQSQNIYYTDPEVGIVLVQVGVTQPRFNVLLRDLDDPHDIFVDPDSGYIFWAERNSVRRAKLSGSSAETILTGISRDTILALDPEAKLLFVLDQSDGVMLSMKYDGSTVTTLFNDPDNYTSGMFSGLAADQGYVFGAIADKAEMVIWDQKSGHRLAQLSFSVTIVKQFGITVTRATVAPPTGPCATNKGGCSQMCIHGSSKTCNCGFGYRLQSDGVSCHPDYPKIQFALVTDIGNDAVYQVDIRTGKVNEFPVAKSSSRRIEGAVYDPEEEAIIWIDTGSGELKSKLVADGSEEITLFTFSNDSIVEGIAYDKKQKMVYYTDSELSQIGSISTKEGQKIILQLTSDETPLKIQVDPDGGYVYWTNVGTTPTIERALMSDGTNRDVLVNTELQNPTGLALSVSESRLYWVDSDLKRIETVSFDGSKREMLQTDTEAYSVSLDPDFLYVAREHEVRRYGSSNNASSTLSPKMFSLLNSINVYLGEDDTSDKDGSGASDIMADLTNHVIMIALCVVWLLQILL